MSGIGTAIFYAVMTLVSEDVLVDTILSLGLMICFYYGLTAFAAAWYFRHELKGPKALLLKGVLPVIGGLTLAGIFVKLVIDTADPAYGSGGSVFGLGTVFVLGVGVLADRRGRDVRVAGARRSVLPRRDAPARHAHRYLSLTMMKSE